MTDEHNALVAPGCESLVKYRKGGKGIGVHRVCDGYSLQRKAASDLSPDPEFLTTTLLVCADGDKVRGRHKRDIKDEGLHEASSVCSHGGGWSLG